MKVSCCPGYTQQNSINYKSIIRVFFSLMTVIQKNVLEQTCGTIPSSGYICAEVAGPVYPGWWGPGVSLLPPPVPAECGCPSLAGRPACLSAGALTSYKLQAVPLHLPLVYLKGLARNLRGVLSLAVSCVTWIRASPGLGGPPALSVPLGPPSVSYTSPLETLPSLGLPGLGCPGVRGSWVAGPGQENRGSERAAGWPGCVCLIKPRESSLRGK